jgi:hypothetical protein
VDVSKNDTAAEHVEGVDGGSVVAHEPVADERLRLLGE